MKRKNLIQRAIEYITGPVEQKAGVTYGKEMRAYLRYPTNSYNEIYTTSYSGEKNLGGMGPAKNYWLDYHALRVRGWQSFTEADISPMVIRRFTTWVIGIGLKLQSEMNVKALELMGETVDPNEMQQIIEPLWQVSMKLMDYSDQMSLIQIARMAYINTKIGGDVLVVIHVIKNQVKVQLIHGGRVVTPLANRADIYTTKRNRVIHGVEVDSKGKHIAYHVRKPGIQFETTRIKAERNGRRVAFMVYGNKDRVDATRGVPLNSNIMETLKKLDRYKEATVAGAESRAKIAFTVEHDQESTGENPLQTDMVQAYDADLTKIPVTQDGVTKNDKGTSMMENTMINMPIGSKVTMHESKQEVNFSEFYETNVDIAAANANMPPEVAMSKYDSNFSASRAALKDWEHTLLVERDYFSEQFYDRIYAIWLDLYSAREILSIPGYNAAMMDKNEMKLVAYRNARWIGASVPHIDPLKEVRAEREKLGPLAANVPLTTVEQSTETLNSGDYQVIQDRFKQEIEGYEVESGNGATTE